VNDIAPGCLVMWVSRVSGTASACLFLRLATDECTSGVVNLPSGVATLVVARRMYEQRWDLLCLTPDSHLGWLFEDLATRLA
jgi:hypothetical protein